MTEKPVCDGCGQYPASYEAKKTRVLCYVCLGCVQYYCDLGFDANLLRPPVVRPSDCPAVAPGASA